MNVVLDISVADLQGRVFLTWTPVQATARLLNVPVGSASVDVTLRNAGTGGQLLFDQSRSDQGTGTLTLTLPADGTPVAFWIAGEFLSPSVDLDDAAVEAVGPGGVLGSKTVTVRVRKNANGLTRPERDRFLDAFAVLNGSGTGRFTDFREMHRSISDSEAHGNVGFLPWHRAYLLDLERELQAIDLSVALPYWRFDQPAPNVFSLSFMGLPNRVGRVQFSAGHPLGSWRTDGQVGITRGMKFRRDTAPNVRSERQTIFPHDTYGAFDTMEMNPHGRAHTRFLGFMSRIATAARDPLFFMLHANVDRLWAKWQWSKRRSDPTDPDAFAPAIPNRVGHRLNDTMWPWNGITTSPRPPAAPGGGLAASPVTPHPGASPTVGSMLDFQGVTATTILGFAYDDVPFEL